MTNFEKTLTFNDQAHQLDALENISRSLPTRFQSWDEDWYTAWGLTLSPPLFSSSPSSHSPDDVICPAGVGVHVEEGRLDAARDQEYRALVLREPKMPGADVVKVLLTGEAVGVNEERRVYVEQMGLLARRDGGGECCGLL